MPNLDAVSAAPKPLRTAQDATPNREPATPIAVPIDSVGPYKPVPSELTGVDSKRRAGASPTGASLRETTRRTSERPGPLQLPNKFAKDVIARTHYSTEDVDRLARQYDAMTPAQRRVAMRHIYRNNPAALPELMRRAATRNPKFFDQLVFDVAKKLVDEDLVTGPNDQAFIWAAMDTSGPGSRDVRLAVHNMVLEAIDVGMKTDRSWEKAMDIGRQTAASVDDPTTGHLVALYHTNPDKLAAELATMATTDPEAFALALDAIRKHRGFGAARGREFSNFVDAVAQHQGPGSSRVRLELALDTSDPKALGKLLADPEVVRHLATGDQIPEFEGMLRTLLEKAPDEAKAVISNAVQAWTLEASAAAKRGDADGVRRAGQRTGLLIGATAKAMNAANIERDRQIDILGDVLGAITSLLVALLPGATAVQRGGKKVLDLATSATIDYATEARKSSKPPTEVFVERVMDTAKSTFRATTDSTELPADDTDYFDFRMGMMDGYDAGQKRGVSR